MPNHRNSFCHNPATCFCAGWVLLAALSHSLQAQSLPVVHLINNAGQHADTTLNTSTNFATSFKGSNDVVVTLCPVRCVPFMLTPSEVLRPETILRI